MAGISASCKKVPVQAAVEDCLMPDQEQQRSLASTNEEDTTEEVTRVCVLPQQDPQANLEINAAFRDFEKFPANRKSKMLEAIERLKVVVNSTEFRQRVEDYVYNGRYQFVDNLGLTNEQIYFRIMDGAETLNNIVDNKMDIDITLYYSNNGTVGYTYPNTTRTWVNDKFLNANTLGQVAANVVHEWTHKIGFGHDFNSTASRPYSVPYGVGSIVRELVDSM